MPADQDVRSVAPDPAARPVARAAGIARLRDAVADQVRAAGDGLVLDAAGLDGPRLAAVAEGAALGGYRFRAGPSGPEAGHHHRVDLAGVADPDAVLAGAARAAATNWARDLANTPAATANPAWLGRQAQRVLGPLGVAVEVHDERWLAERRFGGVLAVGGGSVSPPRLVEAGWRPRGARRGVHVVLVGKGITFDTGGINLKPGESMRMMHTDMSGGAAVLGALRLVAQREVPVRVTALVPAAENAFGGAAMRPSDVIRHYGGRTSEVNNTDAEGRLVLADALAYAAARLRPTVLVDAATLTGAMKVSLGLRTGGLFATDDRVARGLLRAGERTGESLWRMPLAADYAGALHSDVADADNSPGAPGAITAALFLQPFTAGRPWAHLDIAGPARSTQASGVWPLGATGFGARLLAEWVESLA